jgi:hypothetical protein
MSLGLQNVYAQPVQASLQWSDTTGQQAICTFVITLTDTSIVAIETGLGTTRNTTDLFLNEFVFDQNTGLPTGCSWLQQGNKVFITIGPIDLQPYCYGSVRIKESPNEWSEPYLFLQH